MQTQTKKKIAEWLMDIAKYMFTAVLISSIFKDFENKWLVYVSCSVSVLLLLYIGVNLFDKNSNNP
jgi:low affinity Fe/Cu permease